MIGSEQHNTRLKHLADGQQQLWKEFDVRQEQYNTQHGAFRQETSTNSNRLEEELLKMSRVIQTSSDLLTTFAKDVKNSHGGGEDLPSIPTAETMTTRLAQPSVPQPSVLGSPIAALNNQITPSTPTFFCPNHQHFSPLRSCSDIPKTSYQMVNSFPNNTVQGGPYHPGMPTSPPAQSQNLFKPSQPPVSGQLSRSQDHQWQTIQVTPHQTHLTSGGSYTNKVLVSGRTNHLKQALGKILVSSFRDPVTISTSDSTNKDQTGFEHLAKPDEQHCLPTFHGLAQEIQSNAEPAKPSQAHLNQQPCPPVFEATITKTKHNAAHTIRGRVHLCRPLKCPRLPLVPIRRRTPRLPE